jgi:RNA exonuclease 1
VNGENPDEILLDTLVKPELSFTQSNSIAMKHLENIPFTVEHAQQFLCALCSEETVIVGHSIYEYLAAVRMDHQCVIDLSLLYDSNHKHSKSSEFQQIVKDSLNVEISRKNCTLEAASAVIRCLDIWLKIQK